MLLEQSGMFLNLGLRAPGCDYLKICRDFQITFVSLFVSVGARCLHTVGGVAF